MGRRKRHQKQQTPHVDKYAALAARSRANQPVVRHQPQADAVDTTSGDTAPVDEEKVS